MKRRSELFRDGLSALIDKSVNIFGTCPDFLEDAQLAKVECRK